MTKISTEGSAPIGAIVLDTAPLITHSVSPTTLLARSNTLYTTPGVIAEIRDSAARDRYELQWKPFITVRLPGKRGVEEVKAMAKKTGDWEVLSATDLSVLALAYEVEQEEKAKAEKARKEKEEASEGDSEKDNIDKQDEKADASTEEEKQESGADVPIKTLNQATEDASTDSLSTQLEGVKVSEPTGLHPEEVEEDEESEVDEDEKEADADGWITPSNLKKHKKKDESSKEATVQVEEPLHSAVITSDFAMQNVALKLHLNLLSPTTACRIKRVKTWVLRCHACFHITRDMSKQFCPKCGGAGTLLRTSCSTDSKGNFRVYLKKNFQWNNRGNVFSIPKPVHGTASGKGVPKAIILREDQKEYEREVIQQQRRKERDLFDPDYLPSILTGERRVGPGGRVKIGAGRNVNAVKKTRKR